ncbi:hypothetical protein Y1Q_0024540 [Alligator mississippiensis]|uniref:Uncharacterized protein n=1 Tax=Alligator mississippiensis TaxID=8496 RepID=A0A151NBC6_ALLMI|nr:hypothetical protein Y1Q_0024540 [Alligator mississippiensis]
MNPRSQWMLTNDALLGDGQRKWPCSLQDPSGQSLLPGHVHGQLGQVQVGADLKILGLGVAMDVECINKKIIDYKWRACNFLNFIWRKHLWHKQCHLPLLSTDLKCSILKDEKGNAFPPSSFVS